MQIEGYQRASQAGRALGPTGTPAAGKEQQGGAEAASHSLHMADFAQAVDF